MPEYKSQTECRQKALEFIEDLREAGYTADLRENSFRDYSVKVTVGKDGEKYGDVIVYHKPNANSFTLGTHELKIKSNVSEIENIWYGKKVVAVTSQSITKQTNISSVKAYVDGSYVENKIGYGVVILRDEEVIQELSGKIDDHELDSQHQIAGEIQGIIATVEWANQNHITEIEIYFDYAGLEKWAIGEWKTNNALTAKYQAYMENCTVKVIWSKVKGHSGDRWNSRADELARNGAKSNSRQIDQDPKLDLITEVEKVAREFTTILNNNGIDARYDKIYNNMFARIKLYTGIRSINLYIDIYNTAKKHLDIHWPTSVSETWKQSMIALWQTYQSRKAPEASQTEIKHPSFISLDYYYETLKPYRAFNFDFIDFAQALQDLAEDQSSSSTNLYGLRFNFDELEKVYLQIKGENHG